MNQSRRRLTLLAALAAAAVIAQLGATAPHLTHASATTSARKVLWIAMENRSYSAVIGNTAAAPYINNTLLPLAGNATNMHNESHPSLPNYIAMTTGSTNGIADDKNPTAHPLTVPSIFSQVDPSWKAYQEIMPKNCYRLNTTFTNNTQYVVRHNPATYLVAPPISAPNADCNVQDEPLGTATLGNLVTDLSNGTLPAFSFVTPGICHDMHTAPSGLACNPVNAITAGDQWLAAMMPKIFNSSDYTSGALAVFLIWDEGTGGSVVKGGDCLAAPPTDAGCHVPTLVFSTTVTRGSNGTNFSHYSMLKTTEELLGLPTDVLGPNVSAATSMMVAFTP